jgi:hypothetical protein
MSDRPSGGAGAAQLMVAPVENEAIRGRLHTALRDALRARRTVATSALRSALAAIDNAGARPAAGKPGGQQTTAGDSPIHDQER